MGLRLSGGDTVAFDYANDPLAYDSAIGGTLPPTAQGTTLTSVDVLSASPYTMTATLTWSGSGSAGTAGAVRVRGVALGAGASIVATGPGTGGSYATVIVPDDFALGITGGETAGKLQRCRHLLGYVTLGSRRASPGAARPLPRSGGAGTAHAGTACAASVRVRTRWGRTLGASCLRGLVQRGSTRSVFDSTVLSPPPRRAVMRNGTSA